MPQASVDDLLAEFREQAERYRSYWQRTPRFKTALPSPLNPAVVLWQITQREPLRDVSFAFLQDPRLEAFVFPLGREVLKAVQAVRHLWLGISLMQRQRPAEAEMELLRAIEAGMAVEPPAEGVRDAQQAAAWAHFRLAELERAGRPDRAEANYRRANELAQALRLDYLDGLSAAHLGFLLEARHHSRPEASPARQHLERAREKLADLITKFAPDAPKPYQSSVLYTLGMAAYLLGETEPYQMANVCWNKIIHDLPRDERDNPFLAEAYTGRGNLRLKWKEEAEAEKDLEEAVKVDEKDAFALTSLGSLFRGKRQYPRARLHYQEALNAQPAHAEAHLGLALVAVDEGDYEDAVAHCQDAIALRPDYAEAHAVLAEIERAKRGQSWWEWWGQNGWRKFLAGVLAASIVAAIVLPLALPLLPPQFRFVPNSETTTETVQQEATPSASAAQGSPVTTTTKTTVVVKAPSIPPENLVLVGLLLAAFLLPELSRVKVGATGVEVELRPSPAAGAGKAQAQLG